PPLASLLLLHDLRNFLVRGVLGLGLVGVGQFLHLLLTRIPLVLGHLLRLLGGLEGLVAIPADVADGALGFLGELLYAGGHLLSLLAAHGRDGQADDLAVALRRQAQAAGLDGLFDLLDAAGVERADEDLLRVRRADGGELAQRRRRAVV